MLNQRISTVYTGRTIDEGLRSYMIKVYNYMTGGLLITALTAYLLFHTGAISSFFTMSPTGDLSFSPLGWVAFFAPFALVLFFGHSMYRGSLSQVKTVFWLFSATMGVSVAPIMLLYTGESITRVFLISAATFGSMSIYGYTTKRDLTGIGSFLFMGLIGIIIASLLNIYLESTALYFAVSIIGVVVFVGLTATDTQKIRRMYVESTEEFSTRYAINGALVLYMDLINLFLYLLRFLGNRR